MSDTYSRLIALRRDCSGCWPGRSSRFWKASMPSPNTRPHRFPWIVLSAGWRWCETTMCGVCSSLSPMRLSSVPVPLRSGLDNSGFVGWLVSHLKAALGTGVVVCGFNSRRGGVFDYWCVPEKIGAAAIAEVRRLRAPNGYFSPAS